MASKQPEATADQERNLASALEKVAAAEAQRTFVRLAAAAGAKTILDDFERRKAPK